MRACKKQAALPAVEGQFLDGPIVMTLPGQGGQDIQLAYEDGQWALSSLESSREIRRLQAENDRLSAENADLQRQLKKALRLASALQLDMQKLTEQSGGLIAFSSEQKRRQFLEEDPSAVVSRRLGQPVH